jgi:dipeptidyl aminopeptidase/acylaminoacyl peptidase
MPRFARRGLRFKGRGREQLVIHGEQDFRIPYSQGLELFTSLQMRKVPSQLLIFPDEGHWVLKPGNSADWYKTVLDWINNWTVKK